MYKVFGKEYSSINAMDERVEMLVTDNELYGDSDDRFTEIAALNEAIREATYGTAKPYFEEFPVLVCDLANDQLAKEATVLEFKDILTDNEKIRHTFLQRELNKR